MRFGFAATVLILLGAGVFTLNNDIGLENIENFDSSSEKDKLSFCTSKMVEYVNNNSFSDLDLNTGLSDFAFSVDGLKYYSSSAPSEFRCWTGSNEGENVNYRYCSPVVGSGLEYEKVNDSGVIVVQRYISIDEVVLNESDDVVGIECSVLE